MAGCALISLGQLMTQNAPGTVEGKTVLTSSTVPTVAEALLADPKPEETNKVARIREERAKLGISVVQDGPHFVRIYPSRTSSDWLATNVPLRGEALAGSTNPVEIPAGAIMFINVNLDIALLYYGELKGRSLLRSARLPAGAISLQNRCGLSREEAVYALETVLALNGIAVVEDGPRLAQIVLMSERSKVKTNAPMAGVDAKLLDPKEVPAAGAGRAGILPERPKTEFERSVEEWRKALYKFVNYKGPRERSAQRLLEFYAGLSGKEAEGSGKYEGAPVWFYINTPLSKEELIYAIETAFRLNGLRIVEVEGGRIRLGAVDGE